MLEKLVLHLDSGLNLLDNSCLPVILVLDLFDEVLGVHDLFNVFDLLLLLLDDGLLGSG